MRTGFLVLYAEEKGGVSTEIKGVFLSKEDANKAAKGYGFWGSNGEVMSVNIYESYEDYKLN